jgi:integrase
VGLRWSTISWLENKIYIWQRWRRGKIGKPKTPASDSYVALTPVLAGHLELWRKETTYAEETIGCSHPKRRMARRLGLAECWFGITCVRQPNMRGSSSSNEMGATSIPRGRKVTRFGFHNLRKAVSDYLNEGKKADVRTIQDTLRHENPDVTLARHTESSLESRLAAQDVMADAILSDLKRVQ